MLQGALLEEEREPDKLYWTIDADYDFKCGNSREEFFCEIYMSDGKDPKDHKTLAQVRQENLRKSEKSFMR